MSRPHVTRSPGGRRRPQTLDRHSTVRARGAPRSERGAPSVGSRGPERGTPSLGERGEGTRRQEARVGNAAVAAPGEDHERVDYPNPLPQVRGTPLITGRRGGPAARGTPRMIHRHADVRDVPLTRDDTPARLRRDSGEIPARFRRGAPTGRSFERGGPSLDTAAPAASSPTPQRTTARSGVETSYTEPGRVSSAPSTAALRSLSASAPQRTSRSPVSTNATS